MSVLLDTRHRKPPEVDVVLLNWNGWQDTIECLESLRKIDYPNYRLIIVDNGSSNNSVAKIREYAEVTLGAWHNSTLGPRDRPPARTLMMEYTRKEIENGLRHEVLQGQSLPVKLVMIKNERNLGIVEGYNIAIRYALKENSPDFILLLNNDVTVDKNFLKELVKVAGSSLEIGIVGSTIYYYDRPDVINFAGEDIILWKAEGVRYTDHFVVPQEVDKIDGACMLIKKNVFEEIGLIDSDFVMYWEDTDFCQRAKKKGYKVVYVPAAKIWHKIAASGGGLNNYNRRYYLTRNRFLFLKKNVRRLDRILFLTYYFGWQLWFNMAVFLKSRNLKAFAPLIKGSLDGLYLLASTSRNARAFNDTPSRPTRFV
jgi:GT2 family glycosyltransferase